MITTLLSTRGRVWNRQCGCQFFLRWQHSVRVIITDTVDSHHSAGKVLHVSAGYARNYLIPQKKALYAIPDNFQRLGLKDPAIETEEERQMRLAKEAADAANLDLIAANVLEKYLKNKTVSSRSCLTRMAYL
jgi:Ribosomal protein L9, N-terminal domain